MNVAEMIKAAHDNACEKGFWDIMSALDVAHSKRGVEYGVAEGFLDALIAQKIALISTEIAEFHAEAYERESTAMLEELADVVIRVFDLFGFLGIEMNDDVFSSRLNTYSTSSGCALALYREVAMSVQHHRKGNDALFRASLYACIFIAQDYAAYLYEDRYALGKAITAKMEKNRSRPHKHNASY